MKRLLLSYAQDLNDAYPGHEFSIWSEEQLLGFFNEALCLIAAHRPDMFTELKVVRVEPCSNYLDLCDCEKVLDVLGQSNAKGNNIRPIQRRKERATVWTGSKKKQEFTDRITEYELLDKSNLVRVFPQNLDPTKDIYVVVRCSISPKTYALDGEFSQTMQSQAKEHREMFTAILQMVKQADDQYDEKLNGLTRRSR